MNAALGTITTTCRGVGGRSEGIAVRVNERRVTVDGAEHLFYAKYGEQAQEDVEWWECSL